MYYFEHRHFIKLESDQTFMVKNLPTEEVRYHILPPIIDGPYGGGNQFAKALRSSLITKNLYAPNMNSANLVMLNGYPTSDPNLFIIAAKWKTRKKGRRILYRVDGPIAVIRNQPSSASRDTAIYQFCHDFCDGMIIQSQWTKKQIEKHTKAPDCPYTIIRNAPNPEIFYPAHSSKKQESGKIQIVCSSWSTNPQKGFPVYHWLDSALDFSRYNMTVIGAKDHKFKNILAIPAMPQEQLSDYLRSADIYLTASLMESCSNAVMEALHCGLPVIAPNTSSHPEYISHKDLLYSDNLDLLSKLDLLSSNLRYYRNQINVVPLNEIVDQYISFSQHLLASPQKPINKVKLQEFEGSFLPNLSPSQKFKRSVSYALQRFL